MKEKIEIELEYTGTDVDDGTMSLEDMIPALQGFSSAYGKIATLQNPEAQHRLRITGVKKGSFKILLDAWNLMAQHQDQLQIGANIAQVSATMAGGSIVAYKVIDWIIGVIKTTKHTKKQPYTEKINADNQSIVITNCENVTLEIPMEVFRIYKEGLLAQDLNKITKPLNDSRIDSTTLKVKSGTQEIQEKISIEEKGFFEVEEIIITSTKEMWLTGVLNSLTKTTNRGFFYLSDGTRISYHLANDKPEDMYKFFVHKGPVKVRCIASLDENLKPAQIDIFEIMPLQVGMFDGIDTKTA